MLAISIIGILIFSVNSVKEKTFTLLETNKLHRLIQLSEKNSGLVHELQKERGKSSGFIGSKGKLFKEELEIQKKITDNALNELKTIFEQLKENIDDEFIYKFNKANLDLKKLERFRENVSSSNVSVNDVIVYYTGINTDFLSLIGFMSSYSTNVEIASSITGYFNFLKGKEVAGIERAVLSVAFSANKFEK